jgi:hypothetical protein
MVDLLRVGAVDAAPAHLLYERGGRGSTAGLAQV